VVIKVVARGLVPDEDFLGTALRVPGVDGPPGRNDFFLEACEGICHNRNVSVTQEKLGEGQIVQACKEGAMFFQGESIFGICYKGCGSLRCVGWVKIDKIALPNPEQRVMYILRGELDALKEVRNCHEFCLVKDGR